MNIDEDDALRWQLKALRRDVAPAADLWPAIERKIAAAPQPAVAPLQRRRYAPLALAASLLLAVGVAWQAIPVTESIGRPDMARTGGDALIRKQAVSMALDYEGALARLEQVDTHPEMKQAFGELDRSAAQILTAIDRDPDAAFLLDQLRRTYARRLQLTQRAALT